MTLRSLQKVAGTVLPVLCTHQRRSNVSDERYNPFLPVCNVSFRKDIEIEKYDVKCIRKWLTGETNHSGKKHVGAGTYQPLLSMTIVTPIDFSERTLGHGFLS